MSKRQFYLVRVFFFSKSIGHWFYLTITGSQSNSFVLCLAEENRCAFFNICWYMMHPSACTDSRLHFYENRPYLQYGYYSLSSPTKYVAQPFVLFRIQLQLKNDQVTRTRILITELINKLEFTLNEDIRFL